LILVIYNKKNHCYCPFIAIVNIVIVRWIEYSLLTNVQETLLRHGCKPIAHWLDLITNELTRVTLKNIVDEGVIISCVNKASDNCIVCWTSIIVVTTVLLTQIANSGIPGEDNKKKACPYYINNWRHILLYLVSLIYYNHKRQQIMRVWEI